MMQIPLEEHLCTHIGQAHQALAARHEAVLRQHGLTRPQYNVLLILSREEHGMSGAQLARACGVTQQSMAGVVTNLQAKDLIHREASADHAKVLIATPTTSGRDLLDRAYQEMTVLERALTDSFTRAELTSLCAHLQRATSIMTAQAAAHRR